MKKFAFGASKFFLGSVFGCVFVLLLFFTQCTYAKKQTFLLSNIALLLFGLGPVLHSFCGSSFSPAL